MTTRTILIADDDPQLVDVLAARCRALGLEVLSAGNGLSALSLIQSARPDLLCLDMNMPSGTGLSVCELINGDPVLGRTPAIILTGNRDCDTIRRCHSLCAYYVPKCSAVWERIGPLIHEILELPENEQA